VGQASSLPSEITGQAQSLLYNKQKRPGKCSPAGAFSLGFALTARIAELIKHD
jgi:hypothetical protein